MNFYFVIFGYGVSFAMMSYDVMTNGTTILAWRIMWRHAIWRGEKHTRTEYGYSFVRTKNGVDVENLSFRSPIVSRVA